MYVTYNKQVCFMHQESFESRFEGENGWREKRGWDIALLSRFKLNVGNNREEWKNGWNRGGIIMLED
jgi:hypothetical protein